ncbi:hypothetical protein NK8_53650 (plasmid) [Caballeronia sp. NK8]|nr:hypothetical protein NK8_53650 [Caballeronia sp. NK8]
MRANRSERRDDRCGGGLAGGHSPGDGIDGRYDVTRRAPDPGWSRQRRIDRIDWSKRGRGHERLERHERFGRRSGLDRLRTGRYGRRGRHGRHGQRIVGRSRQRFGIDRRRKHGWWR